MKIRRDMCSFRKEDFLYYPDSAMQPAPYFFALFLSGYGSMASNSHFNPGRDRKMTDTVQNKIKRARLFRDRLFWFERK